MKKNPHILYREGLKKNGGIFHPFHQNYLGFNPSKKCFQTTPNGLIHENYKNIPIMTPPNLELKLLKPRVIERYLP